MRAHCKRLAIGALLAGLLLAYFFRGMDWGALGEALRGASLWPLAGLVAVTLATFLVRAWRWAALLAPLAPVKYADLFSATMLGYAAGLLVPRAGELLRPWLIARHYPISTSSGFAAIVLERLIDFIAVLALFALYLFALPHPAAQVQSGLIGLLQVGGAAGALVAAVALGAFLALHAHAEGVPQRIEALLRRAPAWMAQGLGRLAGSFALGFAVLRAPGTLRFKIGVQSMLLWLLVGLGFHLNHLAFGIHLPFHAVFLVTAFLVVGVAIPTPGMVGGFHAFYLLALVEVYGIDRETAAAAGIAAHALMSLPVLALGLALLGREGLSVGRVAAVAGNVENPPERRPQGADK